MGVHQLPVRPIYLYLQEQHFVFLFSYFFNTHECFLVQCKRYQTKIPLGPAEMISLLSFLVE